MIMFSIDFKISILLRHSLISFWEFSTNNFELLSSIGPRDELFDIIDKRINEALAESKLDDNAKTGILLVTHGSRLNYNKEFATALYDKFEKTCDLPSGFGFMELCGPSIPESINKLVGEEIQISIMEIKNPELMIFHIF